jgi:hypothetical protein
MPGAMDYVECRSATIAGKTVAHVTCKKSRTPVYLRNRETQQEEFYVRRGPSTDCLGIRETVEYIRQGSKDAKNEIPAT